MSTSYLRIEDMTWPNPDDPTAIEWRLRYGDAESVRLAAASVVSAYKELIRLPQRTRNERVRQIRAAAAAVVLRLRSTPRSGAAHVPDLPGCVHALERLGQRAQGRYRCTGQSGGTEMTHPHSAPSDGLQEFWSWLDGDTPAKCAPETAFVPGQKVHNLGYAITGSGKRRAPTNAIRQRVLDRQGGCCLYCDNPFGHPVQRRSRVILLRLNWDHFVPYAYGRTNEGTNWVAACHVCNNIKSCRMFDTVIEARKYILGRWADKGYVHNPPLVLTPRILGEAS